MSAVRRVAVVLFNLGGPDSPEAIKPFLFNLFSDPAIIRLPWPARMALAGLISTTRFKSAKANYAVMGGASPLTPETLAQASALERALQGQSPNTEFKVVTAMRYWRPTTAEAARAVTAFGPDEVVLLPLYPQYSTTTTASSLAAWSKAYKGPGRVRAVCCYPNLAEVARSHAQRILQAWRAGGEPWPIRLLFSAHGLPETVVTQGDPYKVQVEATAVAVIERLRADLGGDWDWRVCYQSRVGPMKWLGPYTVSAIEEAGSEGLGVLVAPIAFVSEHIETLVELDRDYALVAEHVGCPVYLRAPALGVEQSFIDGLAVLVQKSLVGAQAIAPGGPWGCPATWSGCPRRRVAG